MGAALVRELARKNNIPLQEVMVRNDSPCGSTIGPIMSAKTGMLQIYQLYHFLNTFKEDKRHAVFLIKIKVLTVVLSNIYHQGRGAYVSRCFTNLKMLPQVLKP